MRIHCFISGDVQGVFFRQYTVEAAKENNIVGWVRNLSDGRVEVIAQGDPRDIVKFVALIKMGPETAKVKEIEMQEEKDTDEFTSFERRETA